MNKLKQAISNRKTTIAGLLSSATGFIAAFPEHFGGADAPVVVLSKFVALGGLAALGIASKDFDRTGR